MNYPPRLKNKIAKRPLMRAKIPQRFSFSFQIRNAIKVVRRIIPTFITGNTKMAGSKASALRRKTVVRTFGKPNTNPHIAVCGLILTFFTII